MSYADIKIIKNSKFLKLEPNIPHDIRILEEVPVQAFKHVGKKGSEICIDGVGGAVCQLCAQGDAPKQKFMTNIFDYTANKVLIWEFGTMVAEQLKNLDKSLREQNTDLLALDLKVEASGDGFDRKYAITPRISSKEIPKGLRYHKIDVAGLPF